MRLSNLFPTTKEEIQAMTLEEYVGWTKTSEALDMTRKAYPDVEWGVYSYNSYMLGFYRMHMIWQAHEFLTQELREDMLIRPKRPDPDNYENLNDFKKDLQIHLDLNPLFAGKFWKGPEKNYIYHNDGSKTYLLGALNWDFKTLNDFIPESTKQGIKLYFLDREI